MADETAHAEEPTHADATALSLARELGRARARIAELEAAVVARDTFIAAIGHEMRNPLVPIVLTVERLRELSEEGDTSRIRRSIDILGKATDAFTRRTTQLLDLSRITSGSFGLIVEPLDLSACIGETIERHSDIARRAGCDLIADVTPGVQGHGDRAALEQLLDNLFSNAFKYGAGRPVETVFTRHGTDGRVEVRDGGAGIADEDQAHIFGLFERARNPGSPGLGIGLWITAQIAAAMGGTIGLQSKRGAGATFILTFPLAGPGTPPGHASPRD